MINDMIHYIYKIMFLMGEYKDCYYIGKRSYVGPNVELDRYSGSGVFCKEYFSMYSKELDVTYKKEILEINESYDQNREREKFYIGDLWKTDPMCMNLCQGGLGGEEDFWKGKPVLQYNLDGELIATHKSQMQAASAIGALTSTSISKSCLIPHLTAYGFIWRFEQTPLRLEELEFIKVHAVAVDQYDYSGNFINTYPTIKDASLEIQKSYTTNLHNITTTISECCLGHRKTAYNYIWKKHGEKLDLKDYQGIQVHKENPVYQLDLEGNVIAEYKTLREAASATGCSWQSIQHVCNGLRKSTGGYKWKRDNTKINKYADDRVKLGKSVVQMDLNDKVIATFCTVGEASLNTKTRADGIRSCCNSKQKTANGFKWKWENLQ